MDNFVAAGLTDTFRKFYPDEVKYSWWSARGGAREKNIGWRLDYFLVGQGILSRVVDASITTEMMGSDHCPVGIELQA